jgi:hypothetical protein
MRSALPLYLTLLAYAAVDSHSFAIPPFNSLVSRSNVPLANYIPEMAPKLFKRFKRFGQRKSAQSPIVPGDPPNVVLPPSGGGGGGQNTGAREDLIVSDILNKERDVNAFAGLTRQIESVSTRLNDSSTNTTVLAPTNAALQRLPRKPWESPADYERFGEENAYAGQPGQDRAAENLKRFVEMHVVPDRPWTENTEVETLGGVKVRWTKREDGKYIVSLSPYLQLPAS